jgi:hypothetical protein
MAVGNVELVDEDGQPEGSLVLMSVTKTVG